MEIQHRRIISLNVHCTHSLTHIYRRPNTILIKVDRRYWSPPTDVDHQQKKKKTKISHFVKMLLKSNYHKRNEMRNLTEAIAKVRISNKTKRKWVIAMSITYPTTRRKRWSIFDKAARLKTICRYDGSVFAIAAPAHQTNDTFACRACNNNGRPNVFVVFIHWRRRLFSSSFPLVALEKHLCRKTFYIYVYLSKSSSTSFLY